MFQSWDSGVWSLTSVWGVGYTSAMAARRSPLLWLNLVALLLALAWLWLMPRRAWERLLTAVEQTDTAALARVVDFPRLEDHLRADLTRAVRARSDLSEALVRSAEQQATLASSFAAAGATPEGIRGTLQSFYPAGATPRTAFRYRSPMQVDVELTHEGGASHDTGIFTFRLTGTSWRLVRIQSGWLTAQ